MQVERSVDPIARLVILEVSGTLEDRDLLGLADELQKTPGLEPDFSLLIDLRRASGGEVSGDGVRALASRRLVLSPSARRAVVVGSELGFGMARMYEMLRGEDGGGMRVFSDYDQARRFLETGAA